MGNPFVFGVPVEGANFTDREKEKREILDSLMAGRNFILFAPRRYGKSSLLREVMRGLDKEKFLTLWIDVSEVSTVRGFLERIINQINEFSKAAKLAEFIKTTLPKFLSLFRVGLGDFNITITAPSQAELDELSLEIFDLSEKLAQKSNKRIIVVFDEFQDLLLLGQDLDKKMRAKIQYHRSTSYVFMGSRRSLINKMFFDRRSPFYFIGKKMEINYIAKEDFRPFIKEQFQATSKEINEEIVEHILQITGGHPYFTQYLCFEIWNLTQRKVTSSLVEEALSICIASQSYIYEMLLDQIRSKDRKAVLFYLAEHGSKDIFGMDSLREMEVRNPNGVNYALKALMEKEILEKGKKGEYRFVDPFFAFYLRKKGRGGDRI